MALLAMFAVQAQEAEFDLHCPVKNSKRFDLVVCICGKVKTGGSSSEPREL